MAYDATITTEDEVDVMSGENVNATGATADRKAALVKQAEGFLSTLLKFDLTAGYAGLETNLKLIFNEYGARYAALSLIAFNMSGFATAETAARIHGEDMINIHFARMEKIELLLNLASTQDFLSV